MNNQNYIGQTQNIFGSSIKLTVVEQKENKIIVELDDGRFFRTDIEHWNKGFDKLNNLSESYDKFIGLQGQDKNGNSITICEVDRWKTGNSMKIKVKYDDGTITNSKFQSFLDKKIIKPLNKEDRKKDSYFKQASETTSKKHIGEISYAKSGEKMTIIDYINSKNITVKIDNGLTKKTTYAKFCKGDVYTLDYNNGSFKEKRIGEEKMSTNSGLMKIVEYNSSSDITVLFLNDGTTKKTTYKHFQEGCVESDYFKNLREIEIQKRKELIEKQQKERFELMDKTGESVVLEDGRIATIITFNTQKNIEVSIGNEVIYTNYTTFKNGMVEWLKKDKRKNMVGNIVINHFGTKATITSFIEHNSSFELKLDNGYKFERACFDIEKDFFTTPYDKTFGGVGCLGEKFSPQDYKKIHIMWCGLLDRVVIHSAKDIKRYKAYEDCSICNRWYNFSNFCEDILNMWYDCDEQLDLDKDIKYKGNKEYSPDKCILVPHRINQLFSHWRGMNDSHQVGITFETNGNHKGQWRVKPLGIKEFDGKFRTGVHKHFKNEKDAGEYFRAIKREYVLKVLKSYEEKIPEYVMNFCVKFEFEMDDYLRK